MHSSTLTSGGEGQRVHSFSKPSIVAKNSARFPKLSGWAFWTLPGKIGGHWELPAIAVFHKHIDRVFCAGLLTAIAHMRYWRSCENPAEPVALPRRELFAEGL
jgi:hypothetical protein